MEFVACDISVTHNKHLSNNTYKFVYILLYIAHNNGV
jgi:hypothetical protein